MTLPPGVAAGHPATVDAGIRVLEAGGNAFDAAVAASLASCVAETVMTGLLGGGHAIVYEAASGRVRNLDCFVAVPSGAGGAMTELDVPFGAELVHYRVGAASCAVPGLPAGLDALWRSSGTLPWRELCGPALRLARDGVEMPAAHVACLEMLGPVFVSTDGAPIYAPGGKLLDVGDRLEQPGLVRALELIAEEGAASVYTGTIGEELLRLSDERGGRITRSDLHAYAAQWPEPLGVAYAGTRVSTRPSLNPVAPVLLDLPPLRDLGPRDRVVALLAALGDGRVGDGDTTNLVTVDRAGNACVLTTSLGLGSGDFLPGLDLHLNSMLGEVELLAGGLVPFERMPSMMSPTVALDADGPVLAMGAAGGSRLRTALVGVAAGILDERLDPQDAVDRPRFHPVGRLLHCEPGLPATVLDELERLGWDVREWPSRHHYFGGVSAIASSGAAGDPRRSGHAAVLR
jgi:gamma-glutamyltranspeptidase / glutathione hydrolase